MFKSRRLWRQKIPLLGKKLLNLLKNLLLEILLKSHSKIIIIITMAKELRLKRNRNKFLFLKTLKNLLKKSLQSLLKSLLLKLNKKQLLLKPHQHMKKKLSL